MVTNFILEDIEHRETDLQLPQPSFLEADKGCTTLLRTDNGIYYADIPVHPSPLAKQREKEGYPRFAHHVCQCPRTIHGVLHAARAYKKQVCLQCLLI